MNQNLPKEKIALSGQIRTKQKLNGLSDADMKRLTGLTDSELSNICRGDDSVQMGTYYDVLDALNKYGETA